MKYAKNMLIAALACLSLAACAETETDDFPEETTTQTTAVEYIDYSDKYTPLYRDFFYAYTDLNNLVKSQEVMDSAAEKGYNYKQYTNEFGTSVIIWDDLGNRVEFTFSSLDNSTDVTYYLNKDYYIKLNLIHKKYTVFYAVDNTKFTSLSLAEAENDFYSRIADPLVKHNGEYPGRGNYVKPTTTTTANNSSYDKYVSVSIKFGEYKSAIEVDDGKTLIVKTKIKPSYSNKATINQNYHNVEDMILNQGCDKYDEIQYWAVADMSDGTESKVVSFTVSKAVIDAVKNQTVVANIMGDYVSDLYIHSSLKE